MTAASRWRVNVSATHGGGTAWVNIREIEMRATIGGADQCSGGTASSSTGAAANAFDNNTGTAWTGSAPPEWVEYDFGAPVTVEEVAITVGTTVSDFPSDFTIEYHDGSTWVVAKTVTDVLFMNSQTLTFPVSTNFTPAEASSWRVYMTAVQTAGNWANIAELEFRAASGGVDATGSGTAFASSFNGSDTAAKAFDNSAGTDWQAGGGSLPQWVGYVFPAAQDVREVALTAPAASPGDTPITMELQYHDSSSWVSALTMDTTADWSVGETRVFTRTVPSVIYDDELTDGIRVVDVSAGGSVLEDTLEDGIGASDDAGYPTGTTHSGDAADEAAFVDTVSTSLGGALADTASMGTELLGGLAISASDSVRIRGLLRNIRAQQAEATDAVAVEAALTTLYAIYLAERLPIAQTHIPNQIGNQSISESIAIEELIRRGYPEAVAEGIGVAASHTVQLALRTIEGLGIAGVVAPSFIYNKSTSEQVRIVDAIARFFGAEAVDGVTLAAAMAGVASRADQISEAIGIAEALAPLFILRVTASDTIGIEPAEALQMLFKGTLSEGIELSAAYLSPGDSIVTWAMNTRTAAVTEYSNYAFNSFARMGNKCLGASDSGLYELLGDDDDGTDIIATIRSGFAQWSGTHLGSFKAAYLAVRGAGVYVLKIITADGRTYNYTVTAESMKTAKVNMGKGLRARYFAFELVSAGQDFDLETLEFIPLVAQRRV